MSSWFQDFTKTVQSSVSEATSVLESSVNQAQTVLEKLTLTTPELSAARHELEVAASKKAALKLKLARLLPWETDDPDCRIFTADCQTAILELSTHKATFFGPSELVPQPKSSSEDPVSTHHHHHKPLDELPSDQSKQILAQLEPLPRLLGDDFDMLMHVGLIERLLLVDANLVQMQALYSGGGMREVKFWQNYFIHVAHVRSAAGLALEEIWGDHAVDSTTNTTNKAGTSTTDNATNQQQQHQEEVEEEVVEFTHDHDEAADARGGGGTTSTASDTLNNGFEMVSSSLMMEESAVNDKKLAAGSAAKNEGDDDNVNEDDIDIPDDYELDELEAEIARELEG